MGQPAQKAHARQHRQCIKIRGFPAEGQRGKPDSRTDDREVEGDGRGFLGPGHRLDLHPHDGRQPGKAKPRQNPDHRALAGHGQPFPQHCNHARKAKRHREDHPRRDGFTQKQRRRWQDQNRAQKAKRLGMGDGQIGQRQEGQRHR